MSEGPSASLAASHAAAASWMSLRPLLSVTSSSMATTLSTSSPSLRFPNAISQTRMSAGGTVATVATGCVGQAGLVERCHLYQLGQLDPLHQQLGDPVSAMHDDRRLRVEVDQGYLDFAAVTGVDRARAVDDRRAHARSQTRAGMDQPDHAVWDGNGDAGRHQRPLTGRQLDLERAVKVDARIPVVSTTGHRQIAIQAHNRQRGGHDVRDYSWPRVRYARHVAIRALPRTVVGAVVVVAAGTGAGRADRARGEPGRARTADLGAVCRAASRRRRRPAVVRQDRGARRRR